MTGATEQVRIFTCDNRQLLGILHRPSAANRTLGVVLVVGGPQYRVGSHRQFTLTARAIAQAGFPILRFDYRGMGDSEGPFQGFEFVSADIDSAIGELLLAAPELQGVVLCGLCDSSSACLMYAGKQDRRVRGLLLINPEVRTEVGAALVQLKHYYLQRLLQRSFWSSLVSGKVSPARAAKDFLVTLRNGLFRRSSVHKSVEQGFVQRMYAGLVCFTAPILFVISGRDLTAREFEQLCKNDNDWARATSASHVSKVSCHDADHTFSRKADLAVANQHCVRWLDSICG
jgi:exosortase A-associated hydrolase 1